MLASAKRNSFESLPEFEKVRRIRRKANTNYTANRECIKNTAKIFLTFIKN
jgi:hypothetical protein